MQTAILLSNSPPHMRPRIMGVLSMCIGFGPVGVMAVGTLADHLGAAIAVQIMATTGLAAMIAAGALWPEMRRVQKV